MALTRQGVPLRLSRLPLSLLVLSFALPAAAQDLPPRKPGLWDMQLTFERGHKPYAVKHCVDPATDLALSPLAFPVVYAPPPPGYPITNRCSPLNVNRLGADLTVEWTCHSSSETTTRGVISGSLDSRYAIVMTSRVRDASGGRVTLGPGGPTYTSGPFDEHSSSTLEATWLGPCGADQRPGDIIWPDGKKQNIDGQ